MAWITVPTLPDLHVTEALSTNSTPVSAATTGNKHPMGFVPTAPARREFATPPLGSRSLAKALALGAAAFAPTIALADTTTQDGVNDIISLSHETRSTHAQDAIIMDYFGKHRQELTPSQAKQLADALYSSSNKDHLLQTYAASYSETGGASATPSDTIQTETLVPDESDASLTWTPEAILTVGGAFSVPLFIIGIITYKGNARFRNLVQTGAATLAWPYTASRDAYGKLRMKWEARRAEQNRARQETIAANDRQMRRKKLLDDISSWEEESDDVKRDGLIELIPLIMDMPDREDRRKALTNAVINGFRQIHDVHYLKPALVALSKELGHPTKWRRDDAAFVVKLFLTTHGLSSEEKRRLLDEITRLPAGATADSHHDIAVWKSEWERLLALHPAEPAALGDAGERARAAQGLRQI